MLHKMFQTALLVKRFMWQIYVKIPENDIEVRTKNIRSDKKIGNIDFVSSVYSDGIHS